MKKNLLFLVWVLSHGLLGCSEQFSTSNVVGSPDFSRQFQKELSPADQNWVPATDCHANIGQVLCEVAPSQEANNPLNDRCLGGEEQYKAAFEVLYDTLDPITQKAFCSLRRIFVHSDLTATAYASTVWSMQDGVMVEIPGAMIGVRKSILLNQPSLSSWISWKEQLNFTVPGEFQAPLEYPRYEIDPKISLLSYVMTHEVGHILDFANKLNDVVLGRPECMNETIETREDYMTKCQPKIVAGSWTDFDWESPVSVRPNRNFPLRDKLCFYGCKEHLDSSTQAPLLYDGLAKSSFASTYAATNPMDDFAEAWAARWVVEHQKADILLHGAPSVTISTKEFYNSERFKEKREFIERFARGTIKYP